jgi:hypothetical protein
MRLFGQSQKRRWVNEGKEKGTSLGMCNMCIMCSVA